MQITFVVEYQNEGRVVWSERHERAFQYDASFEHIMAELGRIAIDDFEKMNSIPAGLDAVFGHTFERQADHSWKDLGFVP